MARKPNGGGRKPPSPPDKVGYRKPPKHAQFKPGQSGNPAGRPKGQRNFLTDLLDELSEFVEFNVKGEKKRCSKQRALIKAAFGKAASGDARMLAMFFDKLLAIDPLTEPATEATPDPGDQAILDRYVSRLIAQQPNDGGTK